MMRQLDMFWKKNKEWWYYLKSGFPIIKDDAPPEAKASYDHYLEQIGRKYFDGDTKRVCQSDER